MPESPFDTSIQNQKTEGRIVAALERIAQAFRVLLWNESKEHTLSPIQVQILIFLRFHPADKARVSYLAEEFNLSKATISDAVKALEQKDLLSKEAETKDGRGSVLRLSSKGKKLTDKISLFSTEIQSPLEQMPAAEKQKMLSQLIQIIHHLNLAGIISVQRMCFSCQHYMNKGHMQHYCSLMKKPLASSEIRIDCPEHEAHKKAS